MLITRPLTIALAATLFFSACAGREQPRQEPQNANTATAPSVSQPAILLDPAAAPKQFSEAPMLADLVRQGRLPPVAQRIPEEPMVVKPTDDVGTYGGTWRGVFTGVADGQNLDRLVASPLLSWNAEVEEVIPFVLKGWEVAPDGKSTAISCAQSSASRPSSRCRRPMMKMPTSGDCTKRGATSPCSSS